MEEKEPHPEANPERPKGLLYHYTTLEGFVGILDSDNLRATHIRYMNDSKEFIDALEHLDGFIDEFDISLRPSLRHYLNGAIRMFSGRHGAYVISFTDDEAQLMTRDISPGDRLSQWRAYSGSGKGFSLGFDYGSIDKSGCGKAWDVQGAIAYLLECSYSKEDKRRYFRRTGKFVARKAERTGSGKSDMDLGGGSVLPQPKMAEKRRTDEQTSTQEPFSGIQGEGGFGGDPGREDFGGVGRTV